MRKKKSLLLSASVILEACPPTQGDRDKAYAVLRHSFAAYNSFHAVSVPDLQDESEFRRRRERVSNDEFAGWLKELTAKPLSLYKVSVACTREEFDAWLDQAEVLGCRDIFIVGGDASDKRYKRGSLQVCDASSQAQGRGFNCGGIIIPNRRGHFVARPASIDEAERVVTKICDCGFTFFSTQILYESEWMCCLLLDLVRSLKRNQIPKIFLTFSPFVTRDEISFAKKTLGVFIPKDVERMLRGARSMREESISCLIGVWDRILSFAGQIGFPEEKLGVNVEYLDTRNPRAVDASFELAEEFGRIFRRRSKQLSMKK
jgi:5,10-methylenetetrahydrofolate reductase